MYDVAEVLRRLDEHAGTVALLLVFAWGGGFAQIVEALRLGVRERVAGQPVGTTIVMLAHDLTFSLGFHHWFGEIGHPFFELFWVGMVVSNLIELVLLWHWVRHRGTVGGVRLPTAATWALLAGYLAMALGGWWWARSLFDDPLDLVGLTVVQVGAVVFGVPMLLGRGTARGQSRIFVWATLLGPGSLGFLFIPYLAPAAFATSAPFWLVVLATAGCAVAFLLLYERLRRADARVSAAAVTEAQPA